MPFAWNCCGFQWCGTSSQFVYHFLSHRNKRCQMRQTTPTGVGWVICDCLSNSAFLVSKQHRHYHEAVPSFSWKCTSHWKCIHNKTCVSNYGKTRVLTSQCFSLEGMVLCLLLDLVSISLSTYLFINYWFIRQGHKLLFVNALELA